ncbi:pfkB family kinase [Clohesyomyces aquaticus]|uniref:PfkB family kinase n=1 Tax=Clohesyomyces aquaticus TaxID=1231657 RepID=A0A1Y1ZZJ1_9PLEO|nr:pfkB family kinase [Clohesyomyces aquaticus]
MEKTIPDISCVSLGMVILDDIQFPNKPTLTNVTGGSSSYVTLGNRLFAPHPAKVGCIILAGEDFPQAVEEELRSWSITLILKMQENVRSSRGLLEYEDNTFGPKKFRYTTTPIKILPTDLASTPLLGAKAIHLFATPEEILNQVPEILHLRKVHGILELPLLVWEPFPASCNIENRHSFPDACKLVDVFSPNHLEVTAIFTNKRSDVFEQSKLESYANEFLTSGVGPQGRGTIIIRAAEHGALTANLSTRATWLPSYYKKDHEKIVDPTGAGNSFIGGYMAGWQSTGDVIKATCYGHVAASFALEQIGLPKYGKEGSLEVWHGTSAEDRLKEYMARLEGAGVKSESFV